jgi:hypothetical protein
MSLSIITHPLLTFGVGVLVAVVATAALFSYHSEPNRSEERVAFYHNRLEKLPSSRLEAGGPGEKAALQRFTDFLQNLGNKAYIRDHTLKVYAADAYLDDTLVEHRGAASIESYFVKTSETMTSYDLVIDDIARSGEDFYIRWTMTFAAPALSGGKPVRSVGISQVRFNREGKVAFHCDFWDSGKNFFAHLPGAGGAIGFIRKKLESNQETN